MIFQQVSPDDDIKASAYNNLRSDMPQTGMVVLHGGAAAPTGWFLCDGSGKDTTTEATLFAIIGYTFGGAGATFNLPDLRDRFAVGHKTAIKVIGTTGSGSFTITTSNMIGHTHSITTDVAHLHQLQSADGGGGGTKRARRGTVTTSQSSQITSSSSGAHDHSGATDSEGSATALTILPTYLTINYIIKF